MSNELVNTQTFRIGQAGAPKRGRRVAVHLFPSGNHPQRLRHMPLAGTHGSCGQLRWSWQKKKTKKLKITYIHIMLNG